MSSGTTRTTSTAVAPVSQSQHWSKDRRHGIPRDDDECSRFRSMSGVVRYSSPKHDTYTRLRFRSNALRMPRLWRWHRRSRHEHLSSLWRTVGEQYSPARLAVQSDGHPHIRHRRDETDPLVRMFCRTSGRRLNESKTGLPARFPRNRRCTNLVL